MIDGVPGSTPGSEMQNSLSGIPGAPPPPAEVKVRTMRSDLESMALSGGGVPRFQNVKVSGLALGKEDNDPGAARNKQIKIAVITGGILLLAIVLIYFAYHAFFGPSGGAAPSVQSNQSGAAPVHHAAPPSAFPPPPSAPVNAITPGTSSTAQSSGEHQSVFRSPADQTLAMIFPASGTVQSAKTLQSYSQRMAATLGGASKTATLIEIIPQFSDGSSMGIEDLLVAAGANKLLSPALLSAHFESDATFFVYHDKAGFWPGYVIPLKPGENWLFLKGDVAALEGSAAIPSLYLSNVGVISPDGFSDGTIGSTTVRTVPFYRNSSVNFVYGWDGNYLILSTSHDGFVSALSHL